MFNNKGLVKWRTALAAFLIAAMAMVSCSKKDNASPELSVSFESTEYSIPQSGEVIMKLVASANVPSTTTIPFNLSGTAVKGTDYELSADAFVFAAGTNVAEVKVTTKASFDKVKLFKVDLGSMPSGIRAGNLLFTEVSIQAKDVLLYTFESQSVTMTESADINLSLETGTGSFVAEKELRIPVVLAEGTTAVEGVNFKFDGPKEFVIPAGKARATVKLKLLKQEAGKDIIFLKLGALNNHYAAGNFAKTKVSIFGSSYERLKGTWKYKGFSNLEWLVLNTQGADDDPKFFPTKNTASDLLMFSDNGLKVDMTGDIRNYFKDASVTNLGEITEVLQEANGFPKPKVKMQLIKLSALNVSFSNSKPNIRAGQLGLRIFVEGGKEILEVTVRDYEPVSFLANTFEMYSMFGDDPILASMPIRYHFERVN